VIGFLNGGSPDGYAPMVSAFRQGLKETSYVEGQNVAIEFRWAGGQYDRVPAMVAELVRRQVAVIVANTPDAPEVKAATTTIPIVFLTGNDPVQIGLVTSPSRPGSNVTGVTTLEAALRICTVKLASIPAGFSRARSPPTYQSSSLRKLSCSSTSRLRNRSVSPSRLRCLVAPTR
jgi:ABC transporter substrate binding protein